jgi:predicted heme/steroid binding protein
MQPIPEEKVFTIEELRRCDGETGPMCISFRGIVYDVSQSRRWRSGIHEGLHFPGQDLTGEFGEAPHGEEVFLHPIIKRVGRLLSDNSSECTTRSKG